MDTPVGYQVIGAGMPVVLLHCSMSSKAQWGRLAQQCKGNFKLISIDLHGYGQAAFPDQGSAFNLNDELTLVEQVLARTLKKGERFHLVGHAYGAAVALRLAFEMRELVASMTLFEPLAFFLLGKEETAYRDWRAQTQKFEAVAGTDNMAAAQVYMDYWIGAGKFDALPLSVRTMMAGHVPKLRLELQALLAENLALASCCKLTIPTCLITGRESPEPVRTVANLLAMVLPDNVRQKVDGGHMAPITHGEEVNKMIVAYLDGREALVALNKDPKATVGARAIAV